MYGKQPASIRSNSDVDRFLLAFRASITRDVIISDLHILFKSVVASVERKPDVRGARTAEVDLVPRR